MHEINYLAVLVCAVAGFVFSTVWYSVWGKQMGKLHKAYAGKQQPKPWQILIEFARNIILALVISLLFDYIGVFDWIAGIEFGLILWLGFPLVLLAGSVLWEKVPVKLAMFHLGDWFVKLLLFSVIIATWK